MTRAEAEATNVLVRWAFGQAPHSEPVELERALLLLARGAHERLGAGVDETQVKEWMR